MGIGNWDDGVFRIRKLLALGGFPSDSFFFFLLVLDMGFGYYGDYEKNGFKEGKFLICLDLCPIPIRGSCHKVVMKILYSLRYYLRIGFLLLY